MFKRTVLWGLFMAFLLSFTGIYAQSREEYTGVMGDNIPDFTVNVNLVAGQTLTVTAEATSGNLDPYLVLLDTSQNVLDENDDIAFGNLNSQIVYTAQQDEAVIVLLTHIRATNGEYRLIIETSAASGTDFTAQSASATIFTGYVGDDVPDNAYPLELVEGQTVTIYAETTSGNLDPYLFLFNDAGHTVAENDDVAPNNLNSLITYIVPQTGTYQLVITNWPRTSGEYQITVESAIGGTAQTIIEPDDTGSTQSIIFSNNTFTGYMGNDVADAEYPITLELGQGVIATAEARSGDLDPIVGIRDASGQLVALNDDRAFNDTDSEAYYIAETAGTYTVVVSNWGSTSGNFELTLTIADATTVDNLSRVRLSGTHRTIETPHFIIHYTLEGEDATTEVFAQNVARIIEQVYEVQVNQMGWPAPVPDGKRGGDSRYDVYITNLLEGGSGTELGFAMPEFPSGDNPNAPGIQTEAVPGYMVIDRAYTAAGSASEIDRLLNATIAHEFHHLIQFGYTSSEPMRWYYEGTATYMETVTLPPYQDASDYVSNAFTYPEICFGAVGDADPLGGILMYSTWVFLQSIMDSHGEGILIELWQNIATWDYWGPLERALATYGDTLPDAVVRHHVQNLLRDYDLAPEFVEQRTVWLENAITAQGTWSFTGRGIQELAANYYTVELPSGAYNFAISGGNGSLEIYAVGVRNGEAEVFALGAGGTMNVSGYEHVNLVVFNRDYNQTSDTCDYVSYEINVTASTSAPAPLAYQQSAKHYRPLQSR